MAPPPPPPGPKSSSSGSRRGGPGGSRSSSTSSRAPRRKARHRGSAPTGRAASGPRGTAESRQPRDRAQDPSAFASATPSPDEQALLADLLQPIWEQTELHSLWRVICHPHAVLGDHAAGTTQLNVAWDADAQALLAQRAPAHQPLHWRDLAVSALTDHTIVIQRAPSPRPQLSLTDWVQQGRLSDLAAQTLSGALALGRNVLLVGPQVPCLELMTALLCEGRRAAIVGTSADPISSSWPCLAGAAQVRQYGADRTAAYALEPAALSTLMGEASGVIGWLDAGVLQRALVRYEAGIDQRSASTASGVTSTGGDSNRAALHVLAGLDLVVVLEAMVDDAVVPGTLHASPWRPQVTQVAEIVLVDEGYRPNLLLATGQAPVPHALVPLATPSFLGPLVTAGYASVAEAWGHALASAAPPPRAGFAPAATPRASRMAPPSAAPSTPSAPPYRASQAAGVPPEGGLNGLHTKPPVQHHGDDPAVAAAMASHPPVDNDAPPPGWELDQLPADESVTGVFGGGGDFDDSAQAAQAADMAATFGLGPPPPPRGSSTGAATASGSSHSTGSAAGHPQEPDFGRLMEQLSRKNMRRTDSDSDSD